MLKLHKFCMKEPGMPRWKMVMEHITTTLINITTDSGGIMKNMETVSFHLEEDHTMVNGSETKLQEEEI